MSWILTIIALIGAFFNSQGEKRGFYFWVISNLGFCIYNACILEWAMCALFFAYLLITINGLCKWKT